MKSRVVVWTIVGVLVLLGVFLVATTPKSPRAPKVTLDVLKAEAGKAEAQLERLVARVGQARKATVPGADPNAGLDEADRLLAQAREKLAQAKHSTDLKHAEQLLQDGKQMLRKARRSVEVASRRTAGPRGL